MIKQISPTDAARDLDSDRCHWLDIRDLQSWQQGHIPGATHIDNDSLAAFVEQTPRDERVIIYCYHGNSSQSAAAWFEQQGFSEAFSLEGGFELWRQHFSEQVRSAADSE